MIAFIKRIKQSQLAQDSIWALIGNIAAKGMGLLGSVVVARFLGKDIFGEYGTIKSTLLSLAIFSTFGLGYTATKYIAEYKITRPEALRQLSHQAMRITLIVSGFMAVILLIFAEYIAEYFLNAIHLTSSLRLLAIWIVFNALTITQIGILSGFNAFKQMAKINTYVGLFAFVSNIILAYYWSLNGALLALLLTQVLNWFLNYKAVNIILPANNKKLNRSFIKEILRFSFPVALQEGLYALTSWIIILLLIKYGGYGEVGLYSAAMQWSAVILFIPGILRNVILTHLSAHTNNEKQHFIVLKRTLGINFFATLAPFIFIWAMMPFILKIYGSTFLDLDRILLIVTLSTIFISLSNVFSQAFMSKSQNWLMFGLRLLRDLSVIILFVYLCQKFNGAAYNLAISILGLNIIFLVIMAWIYFSFRKANV